MFVERSVNSEYHNLHSFEHLQYEYLIIFGYDIIKIIKITLFVKKLSTHCLKLQILFNKDIELQFFYKFMIEGYFCKNDKLLRFDFYFFLNFDTHVINNCNGVSTLNWLNGKLVKMGCRSNVLMI